MSRTPRCPSHFGESNTNRSALQGIPLRWAAEWHNWAPHRLGGAVNSAEAQLTPVSPQISDVETLSTSVGNTSTADTSLTSVSGSSAADASFASASDNSAPVGTRLASAIRESAVASRYRFGGSLRDNDDEPQWVVIVG